MCKLSVLGILTLAFTIIDHTQVFAQRCVEIPNDPALVATCQYVDRTNFLVRTFEIKGATVRGSIQFEINVNINSQNEVVILPINQSPRVVTETIVVVDGVTVTANNPGATIDTMITSTSTSASTTQGTDTTAVGAAETPLTQAERDAIDEFLAASPDTKTFTLNDDGGAVGPIFVPTMTDMIVDDNSTSAAFQKRIVGEKTGNTFYRFRKGSVITVAVLRQEQVVGPFRKSQLSARGIEIAIAQWNAVRLGVRFEFTANLNIAKLQVIGGTFKPSSPAALASCQFPHAGTMRLDVWDSAVSDDFRKVIGGVLTHELGHALGFGHQFDTQGIEVNSPQVLVPGPPVMLATVAANTLVTVSTQDARDARLLYQSLQPPRTNGVPIVLIPVNCNGNCVYLG